jgi:serine/threonine protein kinase
VSRLLPSNGSSKNLFFDIFRLLSAVCSDDFDIDRIKPLLNAVLSHEPDESIWDEVYGAVTKSNPPTILDKRFTDTPCKSNSASQRGKEQKHSQLDPRILQEINGCVYEDTEGFYKKYFEGKEWSGKVDQVAKRANPQVVDGRWTEYPQHPAQDAFYDWFWEFQSNYLQGGRSTFTASADKALPGSDCKRKPDIFLVRSGSSNHDKKYGWADVRVIGELKKSTYKSFTTELIEFSGLAREVFASQPTRRFLHGFFIRGSMMQLSLFDRSGLCVSEDFDIHQDPCLFIKIMAGYSQMSDRELGENIFIKEDDTGRYIDFKGDEKKEEERLYLEKNPIAFQRAIVCRGTTCYRAKRQGSDQWEYVVKFAWRSDKTMAEGALLKRAKEKNVWGVAKLFGHQDLDTIADIRQGLRFGKLWTSQSNIKDLINHSHLQTQSGVVTSASGVSLTSLTSSAQKRKGPVESANPAKKKSRPGSRTGSNTTCLGVSSHTGEKNSLMALDVRKDGLFENRIFSCLAISPPGRSIHEFTSVKELLEVCRDAVKAHKSLYDEGKILHRDISDNNIIIIDAKRQEDPKGMLIDLDLAKELDSDQSGARHRTGTMQFMAIGVLQGSSHTYRHDLEALFYVFLWVIIAHQESDRSLPEGSSLRDWYLGSYIQMANTKRGHMDKQQFRSILAEFPAKFQDLKTVAEELRDILFPYREGLFIGTYSDPDEMYLPMIKAFERALRVIDSR